MIVPFRRRCLHECGSGYTCPNAWYAVALFAGIGIRGGKRMVLFSRQGGRIWRCALDRAALLAFCAGCPLLVPTLDAFVHALHPDAAFGSHALHVSYISGPLALSAMAVALAVLFACLIKPSVSLFGVRARRFAAAGYAVGYLVAAACIVGFARSSVLQIAAGASLGASSAVIVMVWMERLGTKSLFSSFRTVWACFACVFAANLGYALLSPPAIAAVLAASSCIVAVGVAVCAECGDAESSPRSREGSNWWEVLGRLDMASFEGGDDFRTPGACGLFFVGVPMVMMVLFAAGRGVAEALPMPVPAMVLGGAASSVVLVALARFKTDRALVNASYRFFLPAVAFASFALAAFVDPGSQRAVLTTGGFAFLSIYSFMMAGILSSMAGRMASLAFPLSSVCVIAASLACLVASLPVEESVIAQAMYPVFLLLFVAAVALLVATPGSRLWRVVLEGVDAATVDAPDSYEDACARISADFALTPRESEVLMLLCRGHTSAFVAERLVIAGSTARSHRKNIYRKLSVNSREDLFELFDRYRKHKGNDQEK